MSNKTIFSFTGKHRFLSNFYPCKITISEITYPSSEHAYQAHKTDDVDIRKTMAILQTAGAAKKFGKEIPLRRDWEVVKLKVMNSVLRVKFHTNLDIKEMLRQTKEYTLVEGNHWHDTYWGFCTCQKCACGENHLGKLLMDIRKRI